MKIIHSYPQIRINGYKNYFNDLNFNVSGYYIWEYSKLNDMAFIIIYIEKMIN
jgi:hypothetical protein